jgi:hypothetical protein
MAHQNMPWLDDMIARLPAFDPVSTEWFPQQN